MSAAAGTWKLVMQTPIGERKATLVLELGDGALSGTLSSDGRSTAIFDGAASGSDVRFSAAITSPMPLTLHFMAKLSGNAMAGTVSASGAGSWPFSGTRA